MKHVALGTMVLLCGAAFAGDKIDWQKDWKKAVQKAQDEGKPMYVYFGGPG